MIVGTVTGGEERRVGVLSESLTIAQSNRDARQHEAAQQADTEAAWIEAARTDPRAFAPLYDRYAEPIYRFCYRKVGDPDIANDLTAQIFTCAIERIDRYKHREGATFRSWIFTLARNTITDRWRRTRPTRPLDPVVDTLADQDPGPEEHALHRDELSQLLAVLDQLPDNQRDIIELRLSGLTTMEVGDTLGMSRPAVKSAQSRAYKRLRDLLTPPEGASS